MFSINADEKVVGISQDEDSDASKDSRETVDTENSVCPWCFGTGTRIEAGKPAMICQCRRSNSGTTLLKAAQIPERFQACSLGDYDVLNASQHVALSFAKRLVNYYPAVETGLLFIGPVGVGKTHLAVAILKELIETKGVPGLFYESGALLKKIQESYSPISQTSEMRVLAPVYQAEVLVLDELGSTIPTDWVRDTLYQIINNRYNNKRITIFTTNYQDEIHVEDEINNLKSRLAEITHGEANSEKANEEKQIQNRIKSLLATQLLEDRIGTRLRSRLYEMCRKVNIEGDDYRKMRAKHHRFFAS